MEGFINNLTHYLPLAYAYHEIVFDDNNNAVDYVFLDVNPAFEQLLGFQKSDIIGRKVTEVIPGIQNSEADWIRRYARVALNGLTDDFSQYDGILDRWYTVTVYSPEKNYFVTIFQDVTETMRTMDKLERQSKDLGDVSEELNTIFSNTRDALFLVSYENGEFTYIRNNISHQRVTGLSLDEIKGKRPVDVLGEELGGYLEETYMRSVLSGKTITFEDRMEFRTGVRDWFTSLTPIMRDGQVRYIVGSRTDMTEVKQLQDEKENLLERFRSLFYEHTVIQMLIDPASGEVVDINPAACEFYGYTREEALELHAADLIQGLKNRLGESFMAPVGDADVKRSFISSQPLKNGEIRTVEVYTTTIIYGHKPLLSIIMFDVTDRESFQEALNRERNFLRTTLQSIGDGVVTIGIDKRIGSINKAGREILGIGNGEADGEPYVSVLKLVDGKTGKSQTDLFDNVLTNGENYVLPNDTVIINGRGDHIYISGVISPIMDTDNSISGVVKVFRDITGEKRHEEQIIFLSYHDSLTGMHNRRFLETKLLELTSAENLPIGIIMADVNGLKVTNDAFGHAAGDDLLTTVADSIMQVCPASGYCARWGGDEFLLVATNTTQEQMNSLLSEMTERFSSLSSSNLPISVALGSSIMYNEEDSLSNIVRTAEEQMYHKKLLGGKVYRENIINAMINNLYDNSDETDNHADRVRKICLAIGSRMKVSKQELEELSMFSLYHDIGMVVVPPEILLKTDELTCDDWQAIKQHPTVGFRIAQNTYEISAIADYILTHHERWDGQGYPKGISGKEIPLMSRILAVADAFDSMTRKLVYREALPFRRAVEEIKENSGTQFDPEVVKAFMEVLPLVENIV